MMKFVTDEEQIAAIEGAVQMGALVTSVALFYDEGNSDIVLHNPQTGVDTSWGCSLRAGMHARVLMQEQRDRAAYEQLKRKFGDA